MLAKYLIFICIAGFCKSTPEDMQLNQKNLDKFIFLNLKFGCSSSASDAQLIAVDKCYKSGNPEYYEKTIGALAGEGPCAKFVITGDNDATDLKAFCPNIVSSTDLNTRNMLSCIGVEANGYPDPDLIKTTPACKEFAAM